MTATGTVTGAGAGAGTGAGTAFILVSGPFTDGRVWTGVTERLRAAGCEVHPATLAGADPGAGQNVDLEAHIAALVELIDVVEAPTLVLVGHDYGIHPVLGAADRRARRGARIVYLDAGLPQDGDPALAAVPDRSVHELLSAAPADPVPVPAPDGWQRWGSTAGLTEDQLSQLTALAAPQPPATLTQPLKLTGALAAVPTSGILCTAGGMSIDGLQQLVAVGPPQVRALADPRVGFFELATGHWPMLSAPAELAEVLVRAAAGEGRRLTPPAEGQSPYGRPFLLDPPKRPWVRNGRLDLHLPEGDGGPYPAVLFVHGGPVPRDAYPTSRDSEFFLGYARYAAGFGVVGATVDHRLHGVADCAQAAADVAEAVEALRADPRVDQDRIALWFFSGGGLLSADWLGAPPAWLRCLAVNYPVLAPLPGWNTLEPRFRPVEAVRGAGALPIVLTRAGLEAAEMAATVAAFVAAAQDAGAALEVIDVPNGHHGFEAVDRTEESRAAVERAVHTVLGHLHG
ncbi:alpha/beta hydrolase [Streptomyces tateyamensis]|uniref:Alpha/beta hydrolase n=1 Tax=Streptomyces tateyamensis TaxID=565073 RepID=A0A2V4NDE3_9ACTN|nr:alpha/beta fold hydrolase [Streptomyces tateyamensis]PYC79752.1 alpha/beta hydrolase [Streptomyces tateyamensis]